MITLLRSLCFSILLSFVAPVILVGGILTTLFAVGHVPGFTFVGQNGSRQVLQFLEIFGSGYPLQGMVTIGVAFAVVGSLFDLFNFYIYQVSRGE